MKQCLIQNISKTENSEKKLIDLNLSEYNAIFELINLLNMHQFLNSNTMQEFWNGKDIKRVMVQYLELFLQSYDNKLSISVKIDDYIPYEMWPGFRSILKTLPVNEKTELFKDFACYFLHRGINEEIYGERIKDIIYKSSGNDYLKNSEHTIGICLDIFEELALNNKIDQYDSTSFGIKFYLNYFELYHSQKMKDIVNKSVERRSQYQLVSIENYYDSIFLKISKIQNYCNYMIKHHKIGQENKDKFDEILEDCLKFNQSNLSPYEPPQHYQDQLNHLDPNILLEYSRIIHEQLKRISEFL